MTKLRLEFTVGGTPKVGVVVDENEHYYWAEYLTVRLERKLKKIAKKDAVISGPSQKV